MTGKGKGREMSGKKNIDERKAEREARLEAATAALEAALSPAGGELLAAEALVLALQIPLGPRGAAGLIDYCSLKGFAR